MECLFCPYLSMCHKGYVIDCESGEVLDLPDYDSDIGTATVRELESQNCVGYIGPIHNDKSSERR